MKWNENYKIGIEVIDAQHQELFKMIDVFYKNINKGSNKMTMLSLLSQLRKYVVYHFQTEEAILQQFGYDKLDNHKKEHEAFARKIEDIENRCLNGRLTISLELTNFLQSWVSNHVLKTDRDYAVEMVMKGAK